MPAASFFLSCLFHRFSGSCSSPSLCDCQGCDCRGCILVLTWSSSSDVSGGIVCCWLALLVVATTLPMLPRRCGGASSPSATWPPSAARLCPESRRRAGAAASRRCGAPVLGRLMLRRQPGPGLFGPVLLTELYCVVAHVVSPRSAHAAAHTQSPLVARLVHCAAPKGLPTEQYDLPTPGRRLDAAGHSRQQAGIRTRRSSGSSLGCAAKFCLGVIIPRSGQACPGVDNRRTVQPNRTPLSPGLHQGTYREGLASCTCATATLS